MKAWNNSRLGNLKKPVLSLYHAQKHLPPDIEKIYHRR